MSTRQDITVDIQTPRRLVDWAAVGILTALTDRQWHFTQDVDAEILNAGSHPGHKSSAIKGLRNMGYAIACHKARHESGYRLDAAPGEVRAWADQHRKDAYSTIVTLTRSLAGSVSAAPTDPILATQHQAAETAAITMGRALGLPLQQIVSALTPL